MFAALKHVMTGLLAGPNPLTVTATITVGASPRAVAVSPDGTKAYVANQSATSVSVIT
jgi:DNA-binding beta-propeller fold protein YncE